MTPQHLAVAIGGLCALVSANGLAQTPTATHRDSLPKVQYISVQKGVSLEVLDWGGTGRPLVLLAGLGNTAHVFDDFARTLNQKYHTLGITRRGYGASSSPDSGYEADRLGDDVLAVLDSLKLDKSVLVGHSIAGEELSSIGSRYPERVSGLVYLDAAYAYAFYDSALAVQSFGVVPPPLPALAPPDSPADVSSFEALHSWVLHTNGVASPVAELHQQLQTLPGGRVGPSWNSAEVMNVFGQAIDDGIQKYTRIPVPALALYAIPHDRGLRVVNGPARVKSDAADSTRVAQQAQAFARGVPSARVVFLPHANHYIFLSNETDVLREMDQFIATLPPYRAGTKPAR